MSMPGTMRRKGVNSTAHCDTSPGAAPPTPSHPLGALCHGWPAADTLHKGVSSSLRPPLHYSPLSLVTYSFVPDAFFPNPELCPLSSKAAVLADSLPSICTIAPEATRHSALLHHPCWPTNASRGALIGSFRSPHSCSPQRKITGLMQRSFIVPVTGTAHDSETARCPDQRLIQGKLEDLSLLAHGVWRRRNERSSQLRGVLGVPDHVRRAGDAPDAPHSLSTCRR